ncbi:membrane protein [Thermodesulfovibrio sp. N1]|uniref:YeiH family protein n=1 Tax=unclassified Thermodesulfovibrio TaxID=2645936 RepID=UPI00083ABF61|nr:MULTISPECIES: putative sulfate exporter family transporter [unclassified Thermodesulfovibrio]MDI1472348.1 putative sulfate exporter family transporter [Thermodesulfovibrio sp. 1176]ODA43769.1 membrane protein [Thermodesulfovibrio sp. N1]
MGVGVDLLNVKQWPKILPGFIICLIFAWIGLQWDFYVIGELGKGNTEAKRILKAYKEKGELLTYEEYVQKRQNEYQERLKKYEQGLEKKKPSKPFILKKDDYDKLVQTKEIPFKFTFSERMNQFQFTYVAFLLLGGMLIRNTIGLPKILQDGTLAARPIIKPGIIILGAHYMWSDVLRVGAIGLVLVIVFVLGTQIVISIWGKKVRADDGLMGLMGAGVGVCGVSAAVAVAPVVNAKPRDFFYAIGTILLFGTLALFTFPYIGRLLGMSEPVFGAWVGTAILNTAQLVAAATWYGHEALLTANVVNVVRIGFIPIVVMWAIYYYVIRPAKAETGEVQKFSAWQVIKEKFPIFIIGFFIMVTLNELGVFTDTQKSILYRDLVRIFMAIGFAGVGLNIAFQDLKKAGGAAFGIGFTTATAKAILAAIVVMLLGTEIFRIKG